MSSRPSQETRNTEASPSSEATSKSSLIKRTARPRRKGRLAGFDDLPLDIICETASNLGPVDLLRLSRVSKSFRNLVLSPSAKSIWRRVMASIPNLPAPFPGMNEPTFLSLLFEHHCQFCLKTTRSATNWKFRVRMCKACEPKFTIHAKPATFELLHEDFGRPGAGTPRMGPSIYDLFPSYPSRMKFHCLKSDKDEFTQNWDSLPEDHSIRKAFVSQCYKRVDQINQTVRGIHAFLSDNRRTQVMQGAEIARTRKAEIIRRLTSAGWKDEIDSLDRSYPLFSNHHLVAKPQALTDRVWKNVEPGLTRMLQAERSRRQRDSALKNRCTLAKEYLGRYRRDHLDELVNIPPFAAFLKLSEVVDIIERPTDVTVSPQDFEALTPSMPIICLKWVTELRLRLELTLEFFGTLFTTIFDDVDELWDFDLLDDPSELVPLATTVWICKQGPFLPCRSSEDWTCTSEPDEICSDSVVGHHCSPYPQSFPACLHHICSATFDIDSANDYDIYNWTVPQVKVRPDRKAYGVVLAVLDILGMNPSTTLGDDLDALNVKFGCRLCVTEGSEPNTSDLWVADWREMIRHYAARHIAVDDEPSLIALSSEYYTTAPVVHELVTDVPSWLCVHCVALPTDPKVLTFANMMNHLSSHNNVPEDPVEGVDYILAPCAPPQTGMTNAERSKRQILQFPSELVHDLTKSQIKGKARAP